MAEQKTRMTQAELESLPTAFDFATACRAHDIGTTFGYQLMRRGEFPCRVLKIGRKFRVTRADLFRSLGMVESRSGDGAAA